MELPLSSKSSSSVVYKHASACCVRWPCLIPPFRLSQRTALGGAVPYWPLSIFKFSDEDFIGVFRSPGHGKGRISCLRKWELRWSRPEFPRLFPQSARFISWSGFF